MSSKEVEEKQQASTVESSQLDEIKQLLEEFSKVFQQLMSLPPIKMCDHEIPLKPGAQPFKLKPCRYPYSQKDEIEKQVTQIILNHGQNWQNQRHQKTVGSRIG